jgi:arsenate reductase
MAEGLLRELGGGRFEVESAGTRPSAVRPEAVEAMREAGVDIGSHRSKSVDEFEGQAFDYVITVCDNARESCPVFNGNAERVHRGFDDPAAVGGAWEERLAAFCRVRDEIDGWLRAWAAGVE